MKNVCKLRRTHSKRKRQGKVRDVPSTAKEEAGKRRLQRGEQTGKLWLVLEQQVRCPRAGSTLQTAKWGPCFYSQMLISNLSILMSSSMLVKQLRT